MISSIDQVIISANSNVAKYLSKKGGGILTVGNRSSLIPQYMCSDCECYHSYD